MTFDTQRATDTKSSSRALLLGLAIVIGSLVLAAPAHGEPASRSGGTGPDKAAIMVDASRGSVLPFARLDLAILVVGGAVLIMAAASAPLLFRPMRRSAPVFAGPATAPEPLVGAAEQGAHLRATA